ncbi:E3 ubiquitin ligase involved in syntaxin degradation, partial [Trachipleistophora hominis]
VRQEISTILIKLFFYPPQHGSKRMNKRRKATIEMKRSKILKELVNIVEKEKIDVMQKKALVYEIELYKQKNNDLYEKYKELKNENELFYGVIAYLLKSGETEFVSSEFVDEQDAFYKRMIDYIVRYKSLRNKKSHSHKKNAAGAENDENECLDQHNDQIKKIIEQMEESVLLKYKEYVEEKDDIIYHLKRKVLDLNSSLANCGETAPQKAVDKVEKDVNVDELMEAVEASKSEKMGELYKEIEELKKKLLENAKVTGEGEDLSKKKIKDLEDVLKQVEERNCELLRDAQKNAVDFKEALDKMEKERDSYVKDLKQKLESANEVNGLLKEEIGDLEAELDVLKNKMLDEDARSGEELKLRKELNAYKNLKDVVELEKRENHREKERLAEDRESFEQLKNRLNYEVKCLRIELEGRNNAASYHKKNYLKTNAELLYVTERVQSLEKNEIVLREDIKHAQEQQVRLESKLRMLSDDISNYRTVFKALAGTSSPELIESLDKYRKLLRCSTCDKNYKDTVIVKCMHVLCRECVDGRLKMRSRKCPICGEGFSATDVKRIFL